MNTTQLTNKIALVTGASSGLGLEVAKQLSDEGVTVIALARSIEEVTLPDSIVKISLDITDFKGIDTAFEKIDKDFSSIDFLINCAGRGLVKELDKTNREEIVDTLRLNLEGNIYITQEVYQRMIPKQSGHIINVISTSGIKARVDEPIYCASKWGLRGFTESLRMAASAHKIRVTGVFPGGMNTNFWKGKTGRDLAGFMKAEDVAAQIINLLKSPTSIAPSELIIERGFS